MTSIIALRTKDTLYMSGDRALSSEVSGHSVSRQPKVFKVGPALIGFSGMLAFPQAMQSYFVWPYSGNAKPKNFLRTVNKKLREALKQVEEEHDVDLIGTELLIAVYDEIICVEENYQISICDQDIVTSGVDPTAAMAALLGHSPVHHRPKERLIGAQNIMEDMFPGQVSRPFDTLEIKRVG